MSSDADYAAFLERANQNPDSQSSTGTEPGGYATTKAVDTSVPAPLRDLSDMFYTSEADEPFEAVAIKYRKGGDLDEDDFSNLISHSGDVEEQSLESWNVRGEYDSVIEAVEQAAGSGADVRVFRVVHGRTRCEYYVVAVTEQGVLVGVKARAVET